MKQILLFAIVVSASAFVGCKNEPFPLKVLGTPASFTLTDMDGKAYKYEPTGGNVRLVFFGYTQCPDYCPTTLSKLQKVFEKLPLPDGERPEVLFISVDSQRDTPETLKHYLHAFQLPTRGLTGAKTAIDAITRDFGTFYHIEKKGKDIIIDHSTYVYLIDPEGRIRYLFRSQDNVSTLVEGITSLYAEME